MKRILNHSRALFVKYLTFRNTLKQFVTLNKLLNDKTRFKSYYRTLENKAIFTYRHVPSVFLLSSLLFIISCEPKQNTLTIKFVPFYGEQALNCKKSFEQNDQNWLISHLEFYSYNFQVKDHNNQWHQAALKVNQGQHPQVTLIGGICGQQQNWTINLTTSTPIKNIAGIKFRLGLPFELNHVNPLTQLEPLNNSSMFWTWQTGFKFARIELYDKDKQWVFHQGSTGCSSSSAVRAPKQPCKNLNDAEITLDFSSATNQNNEMSVVFDLKALLKNIDMINDNNCQSSPDSEFCNQLLSRMGVNEQATVFRIE
jgi:uncharacterized repeat protein (TIGR04052 family)